MYVSCKRVASFHPVACMLLIGIGAYLLILSAAAYALWPALHMSVHDFGRTFEVTKIAESLLPPLLLPVLFALELALVGWAESSLRQLTVLRARSAFSDLAVFLLVFLPGHKVLIVALSLGLVLLPAAWLHAALARASGWSFDISGGPVALQVVVYFLVYSFFDYWEHRLDHTSWFWPLHRYHHSAEDFCILTAGRVHPAMLTNVLTSFVPAVLIGTSGQALFWSGTFIVMVRYVIHSKINSDFGWAGRWLIQSPLHHRQHHKLNMTEPTANYSLVPLWDRLFGTWAVPNDQTLAIGVTRRYRHGLWVAPDILRDYVDFWRALAGRYRDPPEALQGDLDGVGVGAAENLPGNAAEGELVQPLAAKRM